MYVCMYALIKKYYFKKSYFFKSYNLWKKKMFWDEKIPPKKLEKYWSALETISSLLRLSIVAPPMFRRRLLLKCFNGNTLMGWLCFKFKLRDGAWGVAFHQRLCQRHFRVILDHTKKWLDGRRFFFFFK